MADLPAKQKNCWRASAPWRSRVLRLRSATSIDRYNGPVLFEGDAAGEVFAQQFATGLMSVRTPIGDDSRFEMFFNQLMTQFGGGSFVDKIGGRVLPDFPQRHRQSPGSSTTRARRLLGASEFDDDAVKTRETKLIEHGVLKTLLATRHSGILHSP